MTKQKSARTRRAFRLDVTHFMRTLGITSPEQLCQIDHRAVIAWERIMREQESAAPSIVRRRLSALSSLFKHLVQLDSASRNPVVDVERPTINREECTTAAFKDAGTATARRTNARHCCRSSRSSDSVGWPTSWTTARRDYIAAIMTGHCSSRCVTMLTRTTRLIEWIQTQSTVSFESMAPASTGTRLFRALDASDIHHHGAGERCAASSCAESS